MHTGNERRDLFGDLGEAVAGDQRLGIGVLDDVLDLAGRQPRGNRGEIEPGALRRPADLVIAGVVLHEDADAVAGLETERAKELRALVRTVFEFAKGDGLPRRGHDDGRLVGCLLSGDGRMHARFPEFSGYRWQICRAREGAT
jgi:hypothetical protein